MLNSIKFNMCVQYTDNYPFTTSKRQPDKIRLGITFNKKLSDKHVSAYFKSSEKYQRLPPRK